MEDEKELHYKKYYIQQEKTGACYIYTIYFTLKLQSSLQNYITGLVILGWYRKPKWVAGERLSSNPEQLRQHEHELGVGEFGPPRPLYIKGNEGGGRWVFFKA